VTEARGYVGLTDPDWYGFLSSHPHVDEVNFWQPHGGRTFRALKQGEPFFFKLRAPQKAVVGFGFFERFESMEAWARLGMLRRDERGTGLRVAGRPPRALAWGARTLGATW
jgi:hypothetical protein